jgi:hypothetical protein
MSNRFDKMMSQTDPNDRLVWAARKYEDRLVRRTMDRLKLSDYRRQMAREARDQTGESWLTFHRFNQKFTSFPFALCCHRLLGVPLANTSGPTTLENESDLDAALSAQNKTPSDYAVHKDPRSAEPQRFKSFQAVPFVLAYLQQFRQMESERDMRSVGMIFPRKGFQLGMIIHNDEGERYWTRGLCWVYKGRVLGQDRKFYVQPYSALLEGIYNKGRGWKPES